MSQAGLSQTASPAAPRRGIGPALTRAVQLAAMGLAFVAGLAVLFMIAVTCLDIVLRYFHKTLPGALDLVQIAGAVSIACALPYTTAVKGHVAVEYFFQKLGRRGRIVVDSFARLVGIALFSVLAWKLAEYGSSLRQSGQVTMTLQIPVFWIPWLISLSCAVVVLIKFYHLFHPGKEMIKP